jgi:uncharacterized protein (TIGR02145 family)
VQQTLPSSSSSRPAVVTGSLYDSRDGKSYGTVTIGGKAWMAKNLNYNASGSVCYDNQNSYCDTYGRLYDWATAIAACPSGWHLPSNAEWSTLENSVGGSSTAGKHLKAKDGWYNCGPSGSGKSYSCEDTYGFAALPGGYGSSGGSFYDVGYDGRWWTASEYNSSYAYFRGMHYNYEAASYDYDSKSYLFSVRCAQD